MKRSVLLALTSLSSLLLINACAYEPKTMNKATRVLETKVKPILKEIGPVKLNKTKIDFLTTLQGCQGYHNIFLLVLK